MANTTESIKVTEIYKSLQGESSYAGFPCTFVRLTGCPLRCRWCDTAYGFTGGKDYSIDEILKEVEGHHCELVEITGGEPLAQKEAPKLVQALLENGYRVLIETGGSESVTDIDSRAHLIMDIKCPGSGMSDRNLWANLDFLKPTDEIKFVIADKADFDWAVEVCAKHKLEARFQLLFSPAFGLVKPIDLAQWLLASPLQKSRMQLQQHKYIWNPRARGV